MKRLFSAVLAFILTIALAVTAGAKSAAFPDITDTGLARDVAVLQMLGAVSGDSNGSFSPDGTLTRAAFCKMAVIVIGKGDQESLYKARTIFPDVRAGHWARGYINYAVSGDKKFIVGSSDGTFKPDDPVTVAQAVAMAMRLLGYTDSDAGMLWPDGYITLATDKGVAEGIDMRAPSAFMTRAQAAHLFCNLLGADVKGGGSFIATLGTSAANVVIMQLDVPAADGTAGAVRTSEGVLKTSGGLVPEGILGLRGTLLTNSSGKILTFLPDKNRQLAVTVSLAGAAWLKDTAGVKYDIPSGAAAYTSSEKKTYGAAFIDIAAGMQVTLYYSADGTVDGVYIGTSRTNSALIYGADGSTPVGVLTGGAADYKIFKDGALAAVSDIRPYDVLTYDSASRSLNISDFRLTGYYENCWPNMTNPSLATVLGHEFNVLPSAAESLSQYKVGQTVTFLLTSDLQIAGATTSVSGAAAVGIVQPGITASSATVKLFNGLALSGNPSLTETAAALLSGELVTVYSVGAGQISMSKLYSSGVTGNLDLVRKTLGSAALSPSVRIYERVGAGPAVQISLSDITQAVINSSRVLYAGTDYAGRVDTLVLDDVTGDRYMYGFLKESLIDSGEFDGSTIYNRGVSVTNSTNKSGSAAIITGSAFTDGAPGGVAVKTSGDVTAGIVSLTALSNVKRSSFYTRNDMTYLTVNGVEFPVASNVECYNSLGKTWFASLSDARAFSETLTVYYDRAAADGGKIRMVVAGNS